MLFLPRLLWVALLAIPRSDGPRLRTSLSDELVSPPPSAPHVQVQIVQNIALEGGAPATFLVEREGAESETLHVLLAYEGTAGRSDFQALPDAVVFEAGEISKVVSLLAVMDGISEGTQTLVPLIVPSSFYIVDSSPTPYEIKVQDAVRDQAAFDLAPSVAPIAISQPYAPTASSIPTNETYAPIASQAPTYETYAPMPVSSTLPSAPETKPVLEVLDVARKVTLTKINISRWEDAYNEKKEPADEDPAPALKASFPDGDPDCFHIRVTDALANHDAMKLDKIEVKVSTTGVPSYNDDPTSVELIETGINTGVFDTAKCSILVSDKFDDEWKIDGISDNASVTDGKHDRSHLAHLGSTFHVTYKGFDGQYAVPSDTVRTIKITAKVLKRKATAEDRDEFYFPRERTEAAVVVAKEQYATCAIKLDLTLTDQNALEGMEDLMAPPKLPRKGFFSSDFATGKPLDASKLTEHEKIFFQKVFPGAKDAEVKVAFVPILRTVAGPYAAYQFGMSGLAYVSDVVPDEAYANYLLVSAKGVPFRSDDKAWGEASVLAHEIGHLLAPANSGLPNHQPYRSRIMYVYGTHGERETVNMRKRFSIKECEIFRKSPLVK